MFIDLAAVLLQVTQNDSTFADIVELLKGGAALSTIGILIWILKHFTKLQSQDNKSRDDRYAEVVKSLEATLTKTTERYEKTVNQIDSNYKDAIDKFLQFMNKQNDQNSYNIQILTEIKDKIEKLSEERPDYLSFKREVITLLEKFTLEYELKRKER
ncbi:MAG: hypothetical protein Kow0098_03580 [Ignavibacteriaceae bacterium]